MTTVQDIDVMAMLCLFLSAPCRARLWKMTFALEEAQREYRYGCDIDDTVGWRILGTFPDHTGDMYFPGKRYYNEIEVYEVEKELKTNITGVSMFIRHTSNSNNCRLPLVWMEVMDVYNPEFTLFCNYKPGLVLSTVLNIKSAICSADQFKEELLRHDDGYDDKWSQWPLRDGYLIHYNGRYYHDD